NSNAALANAGFASADPRACVIPTGVPQALLLSEPRKRNRGGCGGGAGDDLPVIGMAARIDPSKGVGEFIEMARILESEGVRARYLVAGEVLGPPAGRKLRAIREYAERVKTYVGMSSLAQSVRFVGHVRDVGAFLDSLDILVMPSWDEPFGRIVIEGMARGLPVVATNAGGVPEIIRGGHDGLLVSPRDPRMLAIACAFLISNPDAAWEIGERARERVERDFRAEQTTDKVLEVYDELTARAHCLSHRSQLLEAAR
ncbi:MAG: glycosyltransferase family 4 protein, partial [Planctomycetes bacterium]|nr:glycosyltransferase family 4 protein [Planctomycetota bacterium]